MTGRVSDCLIHISQGAERRYFLVQHLHDFPPSATGGGTTKDRAVARGAKAAPTMLHKAMVTSVRVKSAMFKAYGST